MAASSWNDWGRVSHRPRNEHRRSRSCHRQCCPFLHSEADGERPVISGELPIGGHPFKGLLPPVVSGPGFTIRRRGSRLIPLTEYVKSKMMTEAQASVIGSAIDARMNIVISGGRSFRSSAGLRARIAGFFDFSFQSGS